MATSNSWPGSTVLGTPRITGDPHKGRSPGVGYEKIHVAVDDATWLSYDEVLADEKGPTTVGFLSRAVARFNGQRIECRRVLSGNGSAYKSHGRRKACQAMDSKPRRPGPTPLGPTARPSDSSRPCWRSGPTSCAGTSAAHNEMRSDGAIKIEMNCRLNYKTNQLNLSILNRVRIFLPSDYSLPDF